MTTYGDYYAISQCIHKRLTEYCIKNDCVDDTYHAARNILTEMDEKARRNDEYRDVVMEWMTTRSTVKLKTALYKANFQVDTLFNFNTFSLLDTVIIKI